jgi:amino-acid N-acetyltransferase
MASSLIAQEELDWVSEKLKLENLCYGDLHNSNVSLWKFDSDGETLGFYGFEIYGKDALLRSVVVVNAERRMHGLGTEIVLESFGKAGELGISNLYLLTFTAKGFFEKLGFSEIDRKSVPDSIASTEEFANFCPDTAVCMTIKVHHGK